MILRVNDGALFRLVAVIIDSSTPRSPRHGSKTKSTGTMAEIDSNGGSADDSDLWNLSCWAKSCQGGVHGEAKADCQGCLFGGGGSFALLKCVKNGPKWPEDRDFDFAALVHHAWLNSDTLPPFFE